MRLGDLRKEVLRARKNKEIAEGKAQLVRKEQKLEESREYYRQGIRNLHTEVQQLQEENNTREEGHHQKENNTREEGIIKRERHSTHIRNWRTKRVLTGNA